MSESDSAESTAVAPETEGDISVAAKGAAKRTAVTAIKSLEETAGASLGLISGTAARSAAAAQHTLGVGASGIGVLEQALETKRERQIAKKEGKSKKARADSERAAARAASQAARAISKAAKAETQAHDAKVKAEVNQVVSTAKGVVERSQKQAEMVAQANREATKDIERSMVVFRFADGKDISIPLKEAITNEVYGYAVKSTAPYKMVDFRKIFKEQSGIELSRALRSASNQTHQYLFPDAPDSSVPSIENLRRRFKFGVPVIMIEKSAKELLAEQQEGQESSLMSGGANSSKYRKTRKRKTRKRKTRKGKTRKGKTRKRKTLRR